MLKPVRVENTPQPTGIDSNRIASETRLNFLMASASPASSGVSTARPIDVLELLRISSATAMTPTTMPDALRMPRWAVSCSDSRRAIAANSPR